MVRPILVEARLSNNFWGYAVIAKTYIKNMLFTKPLRKTIPYEKLYNNKLPIDKLRIWGCLCYLS